MSVPYLGVYCATCEQDCVPMSNGTCGFCDTRVVDEHDRPLHTQPKEEPVALCKIDGCTNSDAGKGGWCVGLCNNHISEEASRRQRVRAQKAAKPTAAADSPRNRNNGADSPKVVISASLVELAQAVEDAKAALEVALAELRQAVA